MNARNTARGLSEYGRYGDSTLVHMQPQEVAGLQALANAQGTSLTINPQTGLPEAFKLGEFFRSLAPTLAGIGVGMIPGMQGIGYGIAAGAATGAALNKDNPLMGAVMGGFGGYGGSNLAASALGNTAGAAVGSTTAAVDPTSFVPNQPFTPPPAPAPYSPSQIPVAPVEGAVAPNFATTAGGGFDPNALGSSVNLAQSDPMLSADALRQSTSAGNSFGSNLSQAYDNVAADPMQFIKDNPYKIGMPLVGATLAGMQPEMIEEDPIGMYDPYARLNLGGGSSRGESGLRLLASGGPISFAEGGSMQGGGTGAMQGAGSFKVTSSDGSGGSRELGLFADQEQINRVRDEIDAAQKQAQQGNRFGMGNTIGMGGMQNPNGGQYGFDGGRGNFDLMQVVKRNQLSDLGNTYGGSLNLGDQKSIKLANGGTIQTGGLQDLYGARDDNMTGPALSRDGYGVGRLNTMAAGGMAGYKKGGYLDGPGDGMSDSIPATIEGKQPARLADGEFVIPADVVSHLGNGSTKAGSKRLYAMLDKIRHARTGNKKQGKQINPNKYLPA